MQRRSQCITAAQACTSPAPTVQLLSMKCCCCCPLARSQVWPEPTTAHNSAMQRARSASQQPRPAPHLPSSAAAHCCSRQCCCCCPLPRSQVCPNSQQLTTVPCNALAVHHSSPGLHLTCPAVQLLTAAPESVLHLLPTAQKPGLPELTTAHIQCHAACSQCITAAQACTSPAQLCSCSLLLQEVLLLLPTGQKPGLPELTTAHNSAMQRARSASQQPQPLHLTCPAHLPSSWLLQLFGICNLYLYSLLVLLYPSTLTGHTHNTLSFRRNLLATLPTHLGPQSPHLRHTPQIGTFGVSSQLFGYMFQCAPCSPTFACWPLFMFTHLYLHFSDLCLGFPVQIKKNLYNT